MTLEQEGLRTTEIRKLNGTPHVAVHDTASGELLRTYPATAGEVKRYSQADSTPRFEPEVEEGLPPNEPNPLGFNG